MNELTHDFEIIIKLIRDYFDGLHEGDVQKLRAIFHEDALLKAAGLRRSREKWLTAVADRPVPQHQGDAYGFKILSIEVVNDQAMAKVEAPLFDNFYVDFLGFLKEGGRWLIVNKTYTTV